MDAGELAARIDHTVLGPTTTPAAVEHALEGALEYGTNVCVPPCYVDGVRDRIDGAGESPGAGAGRGAADGADADEYGRSDAPGEASAGRDRPDREPTLVTVVGFPQGQHATDAKVSEAICAWEDGADELDVVANLGRLRAGERDAVERELAAVVDATPCPVKVIVEAGLLSDEELRTVADCAVAAGASHLKTGTGFAGGPARVADVALLSEYLPVKASGGVGDYATAAAMLAAGAERIGASRGVDIVEDYRRNYAD